MAYQMAEKATLDLNARVTIAKGDKRGGSGVLRYHDAGLQPTLRDVMTQMIITSDNTATDIAIARVGGVPAVNAWLNANGYAPALQLNGTILEVFRNRFVLADPRASTLTADDVYGLGSGELAYGTSPRAFLESIQAGMQKPEVQAENVRRLNEVPASWLGEITPAGVGRMIEAMETGKLTSTASADEMSRMFRSQQSGARRLPHFITVPVGHKTGDFAPAGRQRRRHHLHALRSGGGVVPAERHPRTLRRGRGPHGPRRAGDRRVLRRQALTCPAIQCRGERVAWSDEGASP